MDMGSLLKMGATAFMNSNMSGEAGSGLNIETIVSALSNLIGENAEGGLDIAGLLSNMQGGGMAAMASSFLGGGDNAEMSLTSIMDLFGSDKIASFASELGLSETEAAGGLTEAIPQMIDQASDGGSLLESVGGLGGALGMAGKLFG
ncbi:YidB family protein [Psychromonas sp. PT13]|uniref:YidB family protein n=1 Tax=Psychromonas sp. PT13 TaxID=3439547 RepID=UPI003EBCDDCA